MATLTAERATDADLPIVAKLVQLYMHDFSEFEGQDIDDQGCFHYPALERFWSDPNRSCFMAYVDGKRAGFALVQRGAYHRRDAGESPDLVDMVDFFVLRKYRRHGVGRMLATTCFAQVPGSWQVRTDGYNPGALAFWERTIAIYTQGRYDAYRPVEYPRVIYYFRTQVEP